MSNSPDHRGGRETVAFSSFEPARTVMPSPMMLETIRAPSPITQLRETTLSTISAADPTVLPSRMMLFSTRASGSSLAAS